MHSYATYFDSNYLPRALSLFDSIRTNGDKSEIFALLLDESSKKYFDKNPSDIKVITLEEIEERYPQLLSVKANRSRMEYIFTLTPWLLKYVTEKTSSEVVIYLDSDLYFFNKPQIVVEEMGQSDIGIIAHKYPKALSKALDKYGKFNVGWVGIRKSKDGLDCLNWWADRCLEWCFDKPEPGRYADQGYLDSFTTKFNGVQVLEPRGFNLAPWNSQGVTVRKTADAIWLDRTNTKLVFFHFHGLKRIASWFVTSHLNYMGRASRSLIKELYFPYVEMLTSQEANVRSAGIYVGPANSRGNGLRSIAMRIQRTIFALISIATGNAFTERMATKGGTN